MSRKNRTPDHRKTRALTHVNHTPDDIPHNLVYYSEFGKRRYLCVHEFLLFHRRCITASAMFAIADPKSDKWWQCSRRYRALNLSPPTIVTSDMQYYRKEYSKWSTTFCKGKEYGKYVCLPPVLTFSIKAFGSQNKWKMPLKKTFKDGICKGDAAISRM